MVIVRQPVESSTIAAIGYAPEAGTLDVEFHRGGVYRYFDVPWLLHRGLAAAESKGRYFNAAIRNRFRYQLLESED